MLKKSALAAPCGGGSVSAFDNTWISTLNRNRRKRRMVIFNKFPREFEVQAEVEELYWSIWDELHRRNSESGQG